MAKPTSYEVIGNGPSVILIHGLGLNLNMWQWQLEELAPFFTVVTYDLLGHGDSDAPPGPYSRRQMVDQLARLMEKLEIERAAIVGFSLGGLIAQAFAIEYPEKVKSLVILNSAHARTSEQREAIAKRVQQAADAGPESTIDDALARWFSPEFSRDNPAILQEIRDWVTANDENIYPSVYQLLIDAEIELEKSIADIACPTLVVTGEEDYGNSPEMARNMASVMQNARVEILPGLRHMALAEDPRAVNTLLLAFLNQYR